MHAVFLDQQTFSADIELTDIKNQISSLTCYPLTQPDEVLSRAQDADIIITNKVLLGEQLLAKLPQLKLICIAATGINNVDIDAAKKLNIGVTNVSGYAKGSVPQYVFGQMLEYFSQVSHHNLNVEQGLWQQSPSFCYHGNGSHELADKTLGLIGYGTLAQAVEKIALAFGMKVLIAERPNRENIRTGRIAFNTVVKEADVLSLHCPETTDTIGLINADVFNKMKSSAVLINTARGAIVNEVDLLNALKRNEIAYAILDVLKQEPPAPDHILLTDQPHNLKITAHIAWATIEAQQRLIKILANNIADFIDGKLTNRVDV
ncbi:MULTISPECIES: D-2-hydroxyacid dehydrogenase [Thalassotalea]|uniref:D-2-hydroxyacid dehydrogenase n=1 Tax=Thalassotalea castellviae TaxID=3075612 RepID=A0ABU2ZZW9_9GAMM|nr:D-2-hydroxyacid dehydrogenase [Thalassotalea sp. W431]MDT0603474.1 D-2-hydroxyacid dehydrogenase [Thalassotalea sp. W431]